ncbi:MAG: hypothetical protein RIF32_08660 [Leptospirales bacterium]|jgi:hypothetical protein
MKAIIQKVATATMLILLGALAVYGLLFAIAPEMIRPADDALQLRREQDRATLESLSRQVSRPPARAASDSAKAP